MPEILKRRSLRKGDVLRKILNSTRKYYGAFSDEYVKLYDNWLTSEGAFSDPEYRIGYDHVAKILTGMVEDGQLIVDIGCGVGVWTVHMAKSGANVIGLDHSIEALSKHREKSKEEHVESNVFRIFGDGFNIPFRNDVFNGATLNWVLSHIPVKENLKFTKEVGWILRENAWLMISDSYWRGQEGGKEQVQIRRTINGTFEVYKYYYTPEELKDLLEATFCEVDNLETTCYEMLCVARKFKIV
ncbi:MAG: class I SAM-dependent methyltransferase [Candidatus Bathyarchaeia archaeon]